VKGVDRHGRNDSSGLPTGFVDERCDSGLDTLANNDDSWFANEPIDGVTALIHSHRYFGGAPRTAKLVFDQCGHCTNLTFEVLVHQPLSDLAEDNEETQESEKDSSNDPDDERNRIPAEYGEDDSTSERNEEGQPEPQPRERDSLEDKLDDINEFADAALFLWVSHGALDS
jgi:hypothetical protein